MQHLILSLSILINVFTQAKDFKAEESNISIKTHQNSSALDFPDANFKAFLLADKQINTNGDQEISTIEANAVTFIICDNQNITDLTGIEQFSGLTSLDCGNNPIKTLDLSKNVTLEYLVCDNLNISTLDISENTALTQLSCSGNKLTNLTLSTNVLLKKLDCSGNDLSTLRLSTNSRLEKLVCFKNQLTSLDVSKNLLLNNLSCGYNKFTTIHLKANKNLKYLKCDHSEISGLDLSGNTKLKELKCHHNKLKHLDLSNLKSLKKVLCNNNQIATINLKACTKLSSLNVNENKLTKIDVSTCTSLDYLMCEKNQLTALQTGKNIGLRSINCTNNQITSLDLSNNSGLASLKCSYNQLKTLDASPAISLKTLKLVGNKLEKLNIKSLQLKEFSILKNDQLVCVETDNIEASSHQWRYATEKHTKYSLNCGYSWPTNTQTTTEEISTSNGPASITDGLIAHFPFNSSIEDVSNSKNKGQLTGTPEYTQNKDAKSNGAIAFYNASGNKSGLKVENAKGFNQEQFTVSFWYKPTPTQAKYSGGVITKAYKSRYFNIFQVGNVFNSGDQEKGRKTFVKFNLSMSDDDGKLMTLQAESDDSWHHIAFSVKASGKVNLYLDAKLTDTRVMATNLLKDIPSTIIISHLPTSGDPDMNTVGPLDDYRIYNRELSLEEIKMIYGLNSGQTVSSENDEYNEEDAGLSNLAPPPPSKNNSEEANPDEGLSTLAPPPKPKETAISRVTYNDEKKAFSTTYNNQPYQYKLTSKIDYVNHKSNKTNTVIAYKNASKDENYLGIWNSKLEYQYEYNFKKIAVSNFIIEQDKSYGEGLIIAHYKDVYHGSEFVGLFNEKMEYVGQYEVTGAGNVKITFVEGKPTIEYQYKRKNWTITLDRKGKEIKKKD